MRRIDTTTKFTDLFGAGKHGFRNGDKTVPIAATQLNAEWFNSLQEEIANAIEMAGIALNPAVNTQLATAIALKAPINAPLFTGDARGVTAALYSNNVSLATTAFIQRALGNSSGFYNYSVSATLPLSQLGGFIQFGGTTAGQIYTLNSLNSFAGGSGYWLVNFSNKPVTIAAAGADVIIWPSNSGNTFILYPGESGFLAANTLANWNFWGLANSIGVGQVSSDVTASRALSTVYTNTDRRPRLVSVAMTGSQQSHAQLTITNPYTSASCAFNGSGNSSTNNSQNHIMVIVPSDWTYSAGINVGTPTLISWQESYI